MQHRLQVPPQKRPPEPTQPRRHEALQHRLQEPPQQCPPEPAQPRQQEPRQHRQQGPTQPCPPGPTQPRLPERSHPRQHQDQLLATKGFIWNAFVPVPTTLVDIQMQISSGAMMMASQQSDYTTSGAAKGLPSYRDFHTEAQCQRNTQQPHQGFTKSPHRLHEVWAIILDDMHMALVSQQQALLEHKCDLDRCGLGLSGTTGTVTPHAQQIQAFNEQ